MFLGVSRKIICVVVTPVDTHVKMSTDGVPVTDPTYFHSIAGALQYLTFTHPDIAYAVL